RRHTRSYGDWSSDVCSSDLGMWKCQFQRIDHFVPKKQDVNVDGSRTFLLHASSSHFFFYAEDRGHQLLRSLVSFNFNRAIQKPRLLRELDWLGFIQRRYGEHASRRAEPG